MVSADDNNLEYPVAHHNYIHTRTHVQELTKLS